MSCDCIEKLEKELQEKKSDPTAGIVNTTYFLENDTRRFSVTYVYTKGKFRQQRIGTGLITANYCPFCGKKYTEEAKNG